jgi:hypothetical protein
MSQSDEMARLIDAVSGLEQAVTGIAVILEGHGEMLARLLEAAEEPPPEETVTQQLLRALIGRLDQQQKTLNSIETGIGAFGEALAKTGGQQ